jgi:hypothetical protein
MGLVQPCVLCLQVIKQPTGCCHQNVEALGKGTNLGGWIGSAHHERAGEVEMPTIGAHAFQNLTGKLACGRKNECLAALGHAWLKRRFALGLELVEQGQHKSGGLARASLGNAQHVLTCKHEWNDLRLNRGGGIVTLCLNGLQNGLCEPEISEFRQGWLSIRAARWI